MRLTLDSFTDQEVLSYVLAGLQARYIAIGAKIEEVRGLMQAAPAKSQRAKTPPAKTPAPAKHTASRRPAKTSEQPRQRRELSPESRQRIADAQHRRWAAAKKTPAKTRGQRVQLAPPEPVAPMEELEMAAAE